MDALKKIGLVVSIMLFSPLLVLTTTSVAFSRTIGNQTYTENTLKKVKLYNALSSEIIDKASGQGEQNKIIASALKKSAGPKVAEKIFQPIIDGTYKWLRGDTKTVNFDLKIGVIEKNFKPALTKLLKAKANALPPCTDYSQVSYDIYKLKCIPPGVDVNELVANEVSRVTSTADIFSDSSTSDKKVDSNELGQANINNPSEDLPSSAPKLYQFLNKGLPFFVIGDLIFAALIVILSKNKLYGLRKIGSVLLFNGVILLILGFVVQPTLSNLIPTASSSDTQATISALQKAGKIIISDTSVIIRNFGILFSVLGAVAIVVSTFALKKSSPNPQLKKPLKN